jgi:hypothetical protein
MAVLLRKRQFLLLVSSNLQRQTLILRFIDEWSLLIQSRNAS